MLSILKKFFPQLEQPAPNEMGNIAKQFSSTIFLQGFLYLLGIVSLGVLTKNMTVEDFGHLGVIRAIAETMVFFGAFGASNYLTREIPGGTQEQAFTHFAAVLRNEGKFFALLLIFFFATYQPIMRSLGIAHLGYFPLIFILGHVFFLLNTEVSRFFFLTKRIGVSNFLAILEKTTFVAIIILLCQVLDIPLTVPVVGLLLIFTYALSLCFGIRILPSGFFGALKKSPNLKMWSNLILFLPFFLMDALSFLMLQTEKFFMSALGGATATGLFIFSITFIFFLCKLSTQLYYVAYPYLGTHIKSGQTDSFFRLFFLTFSFAVIVIFGCLVAFFIFPEEIIGFISSESYFHAIPIIRWLFILPIFYFLDTAGQNVLNLLKKEKLIVITLTCSLLLKVCLCAALIEKFKIMGAIVAMVAPFVLQCFVWLIALIKIWPTEISNRQKLFSSP